MSTNQRVFSSAVRMWLNFAIGWKAFNDTFRGLLTDYAVTIGVFSLPANVYVFTASPCVRVHRLQQRRLPQRSSRSSSSRRHSRSRGTT